MDICRKTALDILIDFERKGTYPNLALKSRLRNFTDNRDARFITALVYGVIEQKLTLDYYISKVSSVKINKINVVVMNILRLGLYQIIYMSTPESAACNSSVELAKTNGQLKSSGFVNAVLRKLAKTYSEIPMPETPNEYLSVKYSVAPEVLKILIESLGIEKMEDYLCAANGGDSEIFIAVNTRLIDEDSLCSLLCDEGLTVQRSDIKNLLKVCGSVDIENVKAFADGLFHVIGKPSYICASVVSPKPGDTVYDMCAAPGGKTFVMSNLCDDKAKITAFDVHQHKVENINKDLKRLKINNTRATVSDSGVYRPELERSADCILCDVPCSGLGMIHKKPDIKYKNPDINSLLTLQKNILQNASRYLKEGGRLVYSTCTVNIQENYEQVLEFLNNNPNFEIDKSVMIYDNVYGEMLFLPDFENSYGFYIAVLTKKRCLKLKLISDH